MELSQRLNISGLLPDAADTTEQPASGDTFTQVAALIAQIAGIEQEQVTAGATPSSLGVDSLGQIELVVRAEELFRTRIGEETAKQWATVDDMVAYLAEHSDV